MSDDVKRPRLPFVRNESGPIKAGPAQEPYDPSRASTKVDSSFYQGEATKHALARRTGFPSYLTKKPDPQ